MAVEGRGVHEKNVLEAGFSVIVVGMAENVEPGPLFNGGFFQLFATQVPFVVGHVHDAIRRGVGDEHICVLRDFFPGFVALFVGIFHKGPAFAACDDRRAPKNPAVDLHAVVAEVMHVFGNDFVEFFLGQAFKEKVVVPGHEYFVLVGHFGKPV